MKMPTVCHDGAPGSTQWSRSRVSHIAAHVSAAVGKVFGHLDRGGFGILTYHGMEPCTGSAAPPYNVEPSVFRSQIEGLLNRGFIFARLADVLAAQQAGKPVAPRTVVLTFDDGFRSVYYRAWPILQEFGVPATVLICTGYLDTIAPFPFDGWGHAHGHAASDERLPLTVAQCEEMLAGGLIDLGAHTHTHRDFRDSPDKFERDLRKCVERLEQFGIRRPPFSFPWGDRQAGFCSPELTAAARRTGVSCAMSQESILNQVSADPFAWGRFSVREFDTAATLAGRLNGWFTLAWKVGRILRLAGGDRRRRVEDHPSPGLAVNLRRCVEER